MEQADRALECDLAAADHQHFALHSAQIGQPVACGEATAVHNGTRDLVRLDAEADRHAEPVKAVGERA